MSKRKNSRKSFRDAKKQKTLDDDLFRMLESNGLSYNAKNQTLEGCPSLLRRNLSQLLKNENAEKSFRETFKKSVDDDSKLKLLLSPIDDSSSELKYFRSPVPESTIRVFLNVGYDLQGFVADILVERIPDFIEDDEEIPRLILSSLRWLDQVSNSHELSDKLIECIAIAPTTLKKDIISFIPEILDDNDHERVVPEMLELLDEDSELTISVLDCLSNLCLNNELMMSVRGAVVLLFSTAHLEAIPVVLKFLIHSVTTKADAITVVKLIRDNFPASQFEDGRQTASDDDILKTCLELNANIAKAFFAEISKVSSWREHKVIDFWILLMLHGMAPFRNKVELLFRKKLIQHQFRRSFLKNALEKHTSSLSSLFSSLLEVSSSLIRRAQNTAVATAGITLLTTAFHAFPDPYSKQEVLRVVTMHVGNTGLADINAALETLRRIVTQHYAVVKPYSAIIHGLLDVIDYPNLTHDHIRKIYHIFSELAYHDPDETDTVTETDVNIMITKQLRNREEKYKKMGIIGGITLMAELGSIERSEARGDMNTNEEDEDTKTLDLFKRMIHSCKEEGLHLFSFLFDELVMSLHIGNYRVKVVQFMERFVENIFKERFIEEVSSSTDTGIGLCKTRFAVDRNAEFMLNIAGLIALGKSGDEHLLYLGALFRLLQTCTRYLNNDSLSSIDAVLGCPYNMSTVTTISEFSGLSLEKQESVVSIYFHAVNWTCEIINAFSTSTSQVDEETTGKLYARLRHYYYLRKFLETALQIMQPNTLKNGRLRIKGPKVQGKLYYPYTSKKYGHELREFEVTTFSLLSENIITDEANSKFLSPRTLCLLLSDLEDKLSYLLSSKTIIANGSSNNTRSSSTDGSNGTESCTPSWLGLYASKIACIEDMKGVCTSLVLYYDALHTGQLSTSVVHNSSNSILDNKANKNSATLKTTIRKTSSTDGGDINITVQPISDDEVLEEISGEDEVVNVCQRLILRCLGLLFGNKEFYTKRLEPMRLEILKEINTLTSVSSQRVESMDTEVLLESAFNLFESYLHNADLDIAHSILLLLISIAKKSKSTDLSYRVGNVAGDSLKIKTVNKKIKSELIAGFLKCYLRQCEKPLERLRVVIMSILTPYRLSSPAQIHSRLDQDEDEMEEGYSQNTKVRTTYPTLTDTTYSTYYKTCFTEVCFQLKALGLNNINTPLSREHVRPLQNLYSCTKLFFYLTELTKNHSQSNIIVWSIRSGKLFVETFIRYIPWISKHFTLFQGEFVKVLKSFQSGTRRLQTLCAHGKIVNQKSAIRHIPALKKAMETVIFQVKMLFQQINRLNAFEYDDVFIKKMMRAGTLKHKSIEGAEVSSQVINPSDVSSDDEESLTDENVKEQRVHINRNDNNENDSDDDEEEEEEEEENVNNIDVSDNESSDDSSDEEGDIAPRNVSEEILLRDMAILDKDDEYCSSDSDSDEDEVGIHEISDESSIGDISSISDLDDVDVDDDGSLMDE